jgi:hypothetical protein
MKARTTKTKKIVLVKCHHEKCENQVDKDRPPFAIIRFPMPLFCSEECLKATEGK